MQRFWYAVALAWLMVILARSDMRRDDAQSETLKDIRAQVTALEVMTCK